MSTLALLVLMVVLVLLPMLVMRNAGHRDGGGVPLSKRRVPPVLRVVSLLVAFSLVTLIIRSTVSDLAQRLAPNDVPTQLKMQSPSRALGERYELGEARSLKIDQSDLLITFLAFNTENVITAINTQRVSWVGEPLTVEWERAIDKHETHTCRIDINDVTVRNDGKHQFLELSSSYKVIEERRNGRGSWGGGFSTRRSATGTYSQLRDCPSGHSGIGGGVGVVSLLGRESRRSSADGYGAFIEPLPTADEALSPCDANELLPHVDHTPERIQQRLSDKFSRVYHVAHRLQSQAPFFDLMSRSALPLFLLAMAGVLLAFGVKPFHHATAFIAVALFALLPPAVDRYSVERCRGILQDAQATHSQKSSAIELLSDTFFWGQQCRLALEERIKTEPSAETLFDLRVAQLLMHARHSDAERWVTLYEDTSHKESTWVHSFALGGPGEMPKALFVSAETHSAGFWQGMLMKSLMEIEGASGVLWINWLNFRSNKPVLEKLGSEEEALALITARARQNSTYSEHPLWEKCVTPRVKTYAKETGTAE